MAETPIFSNSVMAFMDTGMGLFLWQEMPATVALTEGETYRVEWNSTEYTCVAFGANFNGVDGIGIGNIALAGLGESTGEPFLLGTGADGSFAACYTTETNETNSMSIYHVTEEDTDGEGGGEDPGDEPSTPEEIPDEPEVSDVGIILLDRKGQPVAHYGIETLTVDTTTEGKQQTFTKGVAVDGLEIVPDFAGGDMAIVAGEDMLVRSAVIRKPEDLVPEKIAEGVSIFGVEGTHKGGDYTITYMNEDGSETLFQKVVMHGDDAGDIVTLGAIDAPTKEATETETYLFIGWSASAGGEVDDTLLCMVTENKTVYAAFDTVIASGECGESVAWRINANGVLTVYGEGAMADYASAANQPWHNYIASITKVIVENGVTKVGNYAFCVTVNETSALRECVLAETVAEIGQRMCLNCTNLKTVILPEALDAIPAYAFYNCKGITSINLPEGITSIGTYAFYGCKLTSILIPDSVTSIGNAAFQSCTDLSIVKLSDNLTGIPQYAFNGCTALEAITIPDSVTIIDQNAFYNCSALKNIYIPDSVTTISAYAFENCTALVCARIGAGVTLIYPYAFRYCNALSAVKFQNTGNWYRRTSATSSSGTSTTVTNVATNATNLRSTYTSSYWTRG